MKETKECELQRYLEDRTIQMCSRNASVEDDFAKKLMAEAASPGRGRRGGCHCCTLSFIIYICFFCRDVDALIRDLRCILRNAYELQDGEI